MNTRAFAGLLSAVGMGVLMQTCMAQEIPQKPTLSIDEAARNKVIAGALKKLSETYIFPDMAKKMEDAIQKRREAKEYDSITDGFVLAGKLTEDLQAISHDKHLRVLCRLQEMPEEKDDKPSPQEEEREREFLRTINYGFEKVERLAGNIGYIDMRGFMPPQYAGDTCAAAMNFLANTDALILDLRQNGGGDPAMVQMLCSYLFEGDPVHLNDLYFRPTDTTQQFWTLPYIPGKRYANKPVYVLTSKRTFSGAEECSYNLKNLKRAILVGETTGGGAHPGGPQRINAHFAVWVPTGRAINPITKDNWEGKGVTPDIAVPAEKALAVAHLDALKKGIEKVSDPARKQNMIEEIARLEKELAEKAQPK